MGGHEDRWRTGKLGHASAQLGFGGGADAVRTVEPLEGPGVLQPLMVVVHARRLGVQYGEELTGLPVGRPIPLGLGPEDQLAVEVLGDEQVGRLVTPEESRGPTTTGQCGDPLAVGDDLPADVVVPRPGRLHHEVAVASAGVEHDGVGQTPAPVRQDLQVRSPLAQQRRLFVGETSRFQHEPDPTAVGSRKPGPSARARAASPA
jgi:hypothetical protein